MCIDFSSVWCRCHRRLSGHNREVEQKDERSNVLKFCTHCNTEHIVELWSVNTWRMTGFYQRGKEETSVLIECDCARVMLHQPAEKMREECTQMGLHSINTHTHTHIHTYTHTHTHTHTHIHTYTHTQNTHTHTRTQTKKRRPALIQINVLGPAVNN